MSPKDRELVSLNFLLAEKILVDNKVRYIKGVEKKATSRYYQNQNFACLICPFHLSKYLKNIQNLKANKLQ